MRDLEIQEMRLLMLHFFCVLTDLVTFDILSHGLQERERCLMIVPHVEEKEMVSPLLMWLQPFLDMLLL